MFLEKPEDRSIEIMWPSISDKILRDFDNSKSNWTEHPTGNLSQA